MFSANIFLGLSPTHWPIRYGYMCRPVSLYVGTSCLMHLTVGRKRIELWNLWNGDQNNLLRIFPYYVVIQLCSRLFLNHHLAPSLLFSLFVCFQHFGFVDCLHSSFYKKNKSINLLSMLLFFLSLSLSPLLLFAFYDDSRCNSIIIPSVCIDDVAFSIYPICGSYTMILIVI